MSAARLPYYLHFVPPDREHGVRLGTYLRENGIELSWPDDERFPGLDARIEGPPADVHLLLTSRQVMQSGSATGFPGRRATADNYVLVQLDDTPPPKDWDDFHRADLRGWDGGADHQGLRTFVDALKQRNFSRLPTGPSRVPPELLSPSVTQVMRKLQSKGRVTAWDIVREILTLHEEYGDRRGGQVAKDSGPATGRKRLVARWLSDVHSLLAPDARKTIHGRLVILGLARLDEELGKYLASEDFLKRIEAELREPIDRVFPLPHRPPPPSDSAPLHIDSPALQDRLGRQAFARALALRLSRIWSEYRNFGETSFVFHLHGPWGAGKTTLLNLLHEELVRPAGERKSNWIVVKFNAWQHQWLDPPWWPLMHTLYLQSRHQLRTRFGIWRALRLMASESWRRLLAGRTDFLIAPLAFVALAGALYLVLGWDSKVGDSQWLNTLAQNAEAVSAILALAGTLLSVSLIVSRSLLSGSASAARTFMDQSSDPMHRVHKHFEDLCSAIDLPVAVLIDDLDRCRREYVVRLLEGIQTLFRNPRVVYVVAADRRWIQACFEATYHEFAGVVHEPGRRLGSLFLEKAVQLSVSVPSMSEEVQKTYWDLLLRAAPYEPAEHEQLRESERQRFAAATTQDEVFSKMTSTDSGADDALRLQVRREVAVERLATAKIEESTEFFLSPFAHLLDPNPRSMKRFVNAYALQRDLAVLAGLDIVDEKRRKQLALWTIVCLRWPIFEEYLLELASRKTPEPTAEVRALLESESVRKVLEGANVGVALTLEAIVAFAGLRASESAVGTVA